MTTGVLPAPKSGGKRRPDKKVKPPADPQKKAQEKAPKKAVIAAPTQPLTAAQNLHFTLSARDWGVFVVVLGAALFGALALGTQFLVARQRLLLSLGQPSDVAGWLLMALDDSLWLALSSWLAFPLLAAALGVALAQGSAASSGGADYKLARVYEALSSQNLAYFARPLPPALTQLMERFAAHLRQVQQERLTAARTGRVMLDAAQALRQMADSAPTDARHYLGLASEIDAAAGARRLIADLDDSGGPLVAGGRYALSLRFDAPASEHSSPSAPSAPSTSLEPPAAEAGHRLTLHLFGESIEVEDRSLALYLPATGPSSEARTHLTVLTPGVCALRVFVTYEHGAAVLQSLRIAVPVQAAPLTARPLRADLLAD